MAKKLPIAILLVGLVSLPVASQQTVGLFVNDAPAPGYTLFSPVGTTNSYLINNDGLLVNSWTGTDRPGLMAYLTPSGSVMRSTKLPAAGFPVAAGDGGRFEEYDWDGNLVWEYEYATATARAHHDVEQMPNGNWLIVAWDLVLEADAIAEGKNPADVNNNVLIDSIIEVQPTPPVGGIVVWEWHARDHLIQDFDPTKGNFGVVGDNPQLIDFNFSTRRDFLHVNGIDYNADLDQIVVSVHSFDEIWVIDHSTTTAEAAGHTGGNSGKGGDLLYRWGNPQAYRAGTAADQQLFRQHDSQWIATGLPGAGNFLVFDNRFAGPIGEYSRVVEIVPPVDVNGNYPLSAGQAWGPAAPSWVYEDNPPEDFFCTNTSGAWRLANGNTLVTCGPLGRMREVESDGTITWDYQNPDTGQGLVTQGGAVNNSGVFKARRYPATHPGLAGRDLTPGDPVEIFSRPLPIATPTLSVDKNGTRAARIDLTWSDGGCPSFEYHLLSGDLADVSTVGVDAGVCDVGTTGFFSWTPVSPGDLFYLVVGTDISGVYESSWGDATAGPRGGTKASFLCGTTTKVLDPQCP